MRKSFFIRNPISQLKGIDGLASVIQNEMGMEPGSGHYYLFCNSKRDRFKILYKEYSGPQSQDQKTAPKL